jgi:TPR repeat protein
MYYAGEGVAEDMAKAAEWFEKAAAQDHPDAQSKLGWMYAGGEYIPKEATKIVEWNQIAAAQGDARAQLALAAMYFQGVGVPKDIAKSLELIQKAAAQGYAEAQYGLGRLYRDGNKGLVPRDLAKSFEWIQKAAEQGHKAAQKNLARIYEKGEGVPKNAIKVFEWWQKAAAQGDDDAEFNLGRLYGIGMGVPVDFKKAFEWTQKAAVKGNSSAQLSLSDMYVHGDGVAKDSVLAYAWQNLGMGQLGLAGYMKRFSQQQSMTEAQIAEAQRLSSAWKKGQILAREEPQRSVGAGTPAAAGSLTKQGTGTAFIVSKLGQAITNNHVIDGCKEVRVEGRDGVAKVSTTDVVNDLALLQVPGAVNAAAAINSDPAKLRQGDDIVVFGFPLNAVLSSGGNLTPGIVSAVTGLGNNSNQIQITAPIQPGSSGSPVLNRKGEVVAVVSMKLSDSKMAKATGSVGQNVNFAVSGQTLKSFLDAHKVEYSTGGLMSFNKSTADLADEAKKWTTVVECWK